MNHSNKPEKVQVYDFDTKVIRDIPAAELAPGMILAKLVIDGEETGPYYVDGSQLKSPLKAPFMHEPFDTSVRDLLKQIQASLEEVYPMSLVQWEEGFRRDANPEREIAIWLHIGKKYQAMTAGKSLSSREKQDYFHIFVSCVNNGRHNALETVDVKLGREVAERAVEFFFA